MALFHWGEGGRGRVALHRAYAKIALPAANVLRPGLPPGGARPCGPAGIVSHATADALGSLRRLGDERKKTSSGATMSPEYLLKASDATPVDVAVNRSTVHLEAQLLPLPSMAVRRTVAL